MILVFAFVKFCFLSLAFFGAGLAQTPADSPVSVESRIDKNRITIGDTLRYSVQLTRDETTRVRWPALGANLGMFEIRDYHKPEPRRTKGRLIEEIAYTISTFDTGRFEIPPLVVEYQVPPDTNWRSLSTEKLEIYVASILPSEAGDIRDIKFPWELPRDWKLILLAGLAVAGILIVAAVAYYFWRRRQGKGLLPSRQEPERPAHELALEALRKLRESDLLATGQIKAFYSELSEIVRRYIEGRYFVPALELTTNELMDGLREVSIEKSATAMLRELLDISDLVKFAKYQPAAKEHEQAVQLAEAFVETTKIIIAAPAEIIDAQTAASPSAPNEAATQSAAIN